MKSEMFDRKELNMYLFPYVNLGKKNCAHQWWASFSWTLQIRPACSIQNSRNVFIWLHLELTQVVLSTPGKRHVEAHLHMVAAVSLRMMEICA